MLLTWVMSILAVVVISIVSDLLLSGKRMGKFVKGVLSSITIMIIVAPLPELLSGKLTLNGDGFMQSVTINENFVEYGNSLKVSSLENAVRSHLESKGYYGVDVKIGGEFSEKINIATVTVNLSNLVMDEKLAHINKYDAIKCEVSEFLDVDKGVIMIYG